MLIAWDAGCCAGSGPTTLLTPFQAPLLPLGVSQPSSSVAVIARNVCERMWCWGHRDASCDVLITATAHLPLPSLCTEGRRGSHWFKGLLFFSLPLSRPLSSSLSLCLAVAVSSLFSLSLFLSVLFSLSPASSPSVLSTNCREGDVMLPCDFSVSAVCGVKSA